MEQGSVEAQEWGGSRPLGGDDTCRDWVVIPVVETQENDER